MNDTPGAPAPDDKTITIDDGKPAPEKPGVLELCKPIPDIAQAMQANLEKPKPKPIVVKQVPRPYTGPKEIGVYFARRDPDDPAKITHQSTIPFEPGRIIKRGGRSYMIMRDGSQRRLEIEKHRKGKFGEKKNENSGTV
jgi:hypothetical protein